MVNKSDRIPPKLSPEELEHQAGMQRVEKPERIYWQEMDAWRANPVGPKPSPFYPRTNVIVGHVYYNNSGEAIPFGSPIWVGYAGNPVDLTWPYTLIGGRNWFSTVNYKYEVELIIVGSNGVETFVETARYHSPHRAEGPMEKQYADHE